MQGNVNFEDILKNSFIETYFQPVVEIASGNVIGYEALSRGPKGSTMYLPSVLIAEAKSRNRMKELDVLMRKMAIVNAEKRGLHKKLFINIDPVSIYEDDITNSVVMKSAEFGLHPRNIVVELSERNAICSFEKFQKIISSYKSRGFSVAFDDVSCALSDIKKLSGVNPDYIKIGGGFVRGIESNVDKRLELSEVIMIAKMMNAKVIAIGVETRGELEVLYGMGIEGVQGNLIGLPQKDFKPISEQAKVILAELIA